MIKKKTITNEKQGQEEFFNYYGILDKVVLQDSNDGVYNGNIFEFKCVINNLGKTLFQAIKYLSKMRLKGESIPKYIDLVDLSNTTVYVYNSDKYIDDIEKIYTGAASKNNTKFDGNVTWDNKYDYSTMAGDANVRKLVCGAKITNKEKYTPINIDSNCIIGWARRYYNENPKAKKADLLGDHGELREPKHFKDLINPYTKGTNVEFNYLLDCLNDSLLQKQTGAFYTPDEYCEKSYELLLDAIDKVPKGNDYVIIDRCAGTGNLERALLNKQDRCGRPIIDHVIVNTLEYYEYLVLLEQIGCCVRHILPVTPVLKGQLLDGANALEKDFIENPIIKQYIDDPKCTIILYENPPYRDEAGTNTKNGQGTGKNKTFVSTEMKKECKSVVTNDILNQFIWSGFKYFLRQSTDSYIIYGPIKYWKCYDICNYDFQGGYIFNRKYFHAADAAVCCIHWANIKDERTKEIGPFSIYDIEEYKNGVGKNAVIKKHLKFIDTLNIKKVYNVPSTLYPKYTYDEKDIIEECCKTNGNLWDSSTKKSVKSYYNQDVVGYMLTSGFQLAPMNKYFIRLCLYNGHGTYLKKNNYKSLLPLWVAKMYPMKNWWEKELLMTAVDCVGNDGKPLYQADDEFIKSCFIYSMLSRYNKCKSLESDKNFFMNELCFDNNTVAYNDLQNYTLDAEEQALVDLWNGILVEARKTSNYNSNYTYGPYQIEDELNTYKVVDVNGKKIRQYDYIDLNSKLESLKSMLADYYESHIKAKLVKYQLVK